MKPLVSILIPAYNAQDWITETLHSAVAQTWPRKEIIVVDDGSTDGTLAIVRRFESEGVKVTTQANQGAAATRNRAFSLSQGDLIQWLDADDILHPEKITRQMALVERLNDPRTLISAAWGQFLYRYHRAEFKPTPLWNDLPPAEWLFRKMGQNLHMQTATWLVSRQVTGAAGPWDTTLLGDDDGEYFCRVLMASNGVRFVPEAKVYYRQSGSSSLSYIGRSARKVEAQWRSMELHIRYLRSLEDSERTRAACIRYLRNWLLIFHPEWPEIVRQAEKTAEELGGRLEIPSLSWKYSWIAATFGLRRAKLVRLVLPGIRWSLARQLDKVLYRFDNRKFAST
jgi:glycosyltransferase involved in cell wall biosynthesis